MPAIPVIEAGPDVDLAAFCGILWKRRVPHRVVERDGRRLVIVATERDARRVADWYRDWQEGALATPPPGKPWWLHAAEAVRRYPALASVLLAAAAVFVITFGGNTALTALFTIVPLTFEGIRPVPAATLMQTLAAGEVWRLLTPALLHFGWLHLLFNVAVVTEFGRRLERATSSRAFLAMVVAIAVVSNVAQHLLGDGPIFGGLSGVAYGLVGMLAVLRARFPDDPDFHVPPALIVSLLVFLVIFTTGVTEPFGLYVANAAHWAGVVAGAALGAAIRPRPGRAR